MSRERLILPAGSWFMMPNAFAIKLPSREALVMGALLNRERVAGSKDEDWFYCPAHVLRRHLGMGLRTQQRALAKLKTMKLIDVKICGTWARKRYVKFLQCVADLIDSVASEVTPSNASEVTPSNASEVTPSNTNKEIQNSKTTSAASGPTVRGMFQELEKQTLGDASSFDRNCAKTLALALQSKRVGVNLTSYRSKWPSEFTKLRERDQVPAQRIESALDWYCDHIGEKYVPVAHSAKAFRAKFDGIERAMKRYRSENPVVELDDAAKKLVNRLRQWDWPKGSASKLAAAVQTTIANYKEFRASLRLVTDSKLTGFVARVQAQWGGSLYFAELWFDEVRKSVEHWDGWSGDLMSFVFEPGHRLAARLGRELSSDFAGTPKRWDALVKEISK